MVLLRIRCVRLVYGNGPLWAEDCRDFVALGANKRRYDFMN